jgi:cellulose synthase (UDP-forming)
VSVPSNDPRLLPPDWDAAELGSRRRLRWLVALAVPLAVWYFGWLLQPGRVGVPALFGLLIAAELFNLIQAAGFWWTVTRRSPPRPAGAPREEAPVVDVLIPVYDEPLDVLEPTVRGALAMRGARLAVSVLDDGCREEVRELARRCGARYVRREESEGAKAGNINSALLSTGAPFVAVFDCDHVPRPGFLERTLPALSDERVAFVQTPQYYANARQGGLAGAAWAQQALFFGAIARGKDAHDSTFCCGTNVVFRRTALESVGGFPTDSLTEDFMLSVKLHERGWETRYVSEVLAVGLGPEDMASYASQQRRWARGCLGAIGATLRARLSARRRAQYLLSSLYFLSGWALLVYMAFPVIRIFTGAQPISQASADQFLIHFAPYFCTALAIVAVAGRGAYSFAGFALAAASFWIHILASLAALLRRAGRFVVTPKRGAGGRQPLAAWPALLAIATLLAASIWGLAHERSPSTLNNVAFALLHATVLGAGARWALMRRPPRGPEVEASAERPPRRAALGAARATACVAVVAVLALLGAGCGSSPAAADPQQLARSSASGFLDRYVEPSGRVVRRDQGGTTVSEGQSYAMLLAVALDRRRGFARVWSWTRGHLQRPDGLLSWLWEDGHVGDREAASDADLDAAYALLLASRRFRRPHYRVEALRIGRRILAKEVAWVRGRPLLVAGPWAQPLPATVDPSYFAPRDFEALARATHDGRWTALGREGRRALARLTSGPPGLPPDWARVEPSGAVHPIPAPGGAQSEPLYSWDAVRVPLRMAASCRAGDRAIAARSAGFLAGAAAHGISSAYSLRGEPVESGGGPVPLVGAAAASAAAGRRGRALALLAQAEAAAAAEPRYYAAALLALARVMLTTRWLGRC